MTLFSTEPNAKWAVSLSENARNYAPWDSCYTPAHLDAIANGTGSRYALSYPEEGSPAYGNIAFVASQLGTSAGGAGTGTPPPLPVSPEPNTYTYPVVGAPPQVQPPSGLADLHAAWQALTDFAGHGAVGIDSYLGQINKAFLHLMGFD